MYTKRRRTGQNSGHSSSVHSTSVIQSLSALPNTFRHMPMIFPAGSKTNCSGIKESTAKPSRSSKQKKRYIPIIIITIVCKSTSKFVDTRHVLILQTWHERCCSHGLGTYPISSFLIFSLAIINVRSVWRLPDVSKREFLHDCHIPCAFHSQEGHVICHTSHDKIHLSCLQCVCSTEL